MKLAMNANAITFKSEVPYSDFKKCRDYAPEALHLKNKNGKIIAGVDFDMFHGDVNKNGITYSDTDAEDAMLYTFICDGIANLTQEERKTWMKDKFGMVIVRMNKIEEQIKAVVGDVNTTLAGLDANITVA